MAESEGTQPIQEAPSRIQDIREALREYSHEQTKPLLDAKHEADPVAGIAIVNLEGGVESPAGQIFHFHGARVFTSSPENPNFVNPHYHESGEEPYRILSGDGGEMNLGWVKDGEVIWDAPRMVAPGDEIEVQENQVHSLRNTGEEPLDFTFACPDEHLIDNSPEHPEGDRYIIRDLPNGIPPQYPR